MIDPLKLLTELILYFRPVPDLITVETGGALLG